MSLVILQTHFIEIGRLVIVSKERDMAVSILENLGGKENIISMTN